MPRGRKKKQELKETEPITRESVLKDAKRLGLFKHNKEFKQYEIILSVNEYEQI